MGRNDCEMKKALIGFWAAVGMLAVLMILSGFGGNHLREDEIDVVFERDYAQIIAVTGYLTALEEDEVYISMDNANPNRIKGECGKPLEFYSEEIERIVGELDNKGYYQVTKRDGVVIFDVWRKPLDAEFESGFAYSADGTGELSTIQFLIGQRPLREQNWYYYEADYNEWRSNRSSVSNGFGR